GIVKRSSLLCHLLARSAKLRGEIFKLWEPVTHRQNGLRVVDMHPWTKHQRRQRSGVYIDQSQRRMGGHQMATALLAVFPLARRRLLEHANVFGANCNPHGIGLPKREGVDWRCRPRTA